MARSRLEKPSMKIAMVAAMVDVRQLCSNLSTQKLSFKLELPQGRPALMSLLSRVAVPLRGLAKLGFKLTAPFGGYARVAHHSRLASKHTIDAGLGVVDRDYTRMGAAVVFSHGDKHFKVEVGDRMAQLIFEKVGTVPFSAGIVAHSVPGTRGFGSIGCTENALAPFFSTTRISTLRSKVETELLS